jgi:hypothetical protein
MIQDPVLHVHIHRDVDPVHDAVPVGKPGRGDVEDDQTFFCSLRSEIA